MESAKISVMFQSEKKLKQATLSFDIINSKSNSTSVNKQILNKLSTVQQEDKNDDDDLEIIEVNGKKECSPERDCEMEVEEVASQVVPEIGNHVPISKIETEKIEQGQSNLCEVIGIDYPEDVSVNKNVEKHNNEIKSEDSDNLKSSKRKLENTEKLKEVKPPKRAKLIYNVDKIKVNQGTSNNKAVNVDCDDKSEQKISKGCNDTSIQVNVEVLKLKPDDYKSNLENKEVGKALEVMNETCESIVPSEGLNESLVDENCSSAKENLTDVHNMEVDSFINSNVVESSEKSSEENCSSPSLKAEKCSPSQRNSTKQLTPKQSERKAEIARRREEIQQERERKKIEKDRIKQERVEEKARLKQEKEEVKKKMKEEKEKKRLAEIELKNEEKRKKEEEKRKKEEEKQEEKRKKEEQKLEDRRKKEEMLKKKEEEQEMQKKKITKEAQAFSNFFKKYDSKNPTGEEGRSCNEVVFMPFAVRADMRLAPVNRNPMNDERRSKFEELFTAQSTEKAYLEELRTQIIEPKKSGNTWPLEEKYDKDVILDEGLDLNEGVIIEPEKKFKDRKPKLLQFYENRRPPYWGTWRKKSKNIRPRAPLGKDEIFDYEVDSDEEWEEEEPGESLHGSDDEKESEDEYEVDNDFFVPHGYLSDDENPEEEIISPEVQKAKLKLLGEQFDLERSEKTKLLKPILLGCIWFNSDTDEPASANPSVIAFLNKRKAVPWTDVIPIPVHQDENIDPAEMMLSDSGTPNSNKESAFPESAIPDLITLVYGSTNSRKNLAKIFLAQWQKKVEEAVAESESNHIMLSQARIVKKIRELAKWEEFPEEGPFYGKFCWYVKKEIREKFGLSDLSILPKSEDVSEARESDSCKKVSPSLITKFTRVLTEDERRNQITKVRKSISTPKMLTESLSNSTGPKQTNSLKCIKKLKEFWPKPSITSKYFPNLTIDDDEVMILGQSKDSNPGEISQKADEVSATKCVDDDCEIIEIKEKNSESALTKEESRQTSIPEVADGSKTPAETETKPVVKKRVAILFSAPRGCEIVKPEVEPKKN